MRQKLTIFTFLLFSTLLLAKGQSKNQLFGSHGNIQSYFRWTPSRMPMLSAHRGGPTKGFPENCIETFENTLAIFPAIIELDVSMTKDSLLILMHDTSIDRTTTGSGKVKDLTYVEIKRYFLKDKLGNQTTYKVPLLEEVLRWSEGKAIISIDIKRNVPLKKVVEIVKELDAVKNTMLILYTGTAAKAAHELAPDMMLSVSVRNMEEFERIQATNIPANRLIAFTGTIESNKKLYQTLHKKSIFCIIGTMGNIDNMARTKGIQVYHELFDKGVDIIAGDFPDLVNKAIKSYKK
ncbi:MAG: glycerophosphodiester phosphodiesterase family protein [Bacteroidota bacterium]